MDVRTCADRFTGDVYTYTRVSVNVCTQVPMWVYATGWRLFLGYSLGAGSQKVVYSPLAPQKLFFYVQGQTIVRLDYSNLRHPL